MLGFPHLVAQLRRHRRRLAHLADARGAIHASIIGGRPETWRSMSCTRRETPPARSGTDTSSPAVPEGHVGRTPGEESGDITQRQGGQPDADLSLARGLCRRGRGRIPSDRGRWHLGRRVRRPRREGPGQRADAGVQLDPVHGDLRRLRRELLPRPRRLRLVPQRGRQLLRGADRGRTATEPPKQIAAPEAGAASADTPSPRSRRARPRTSRSRSPSSRPRARTRRTTSSSSSSRSTASQPRPTTTSPPRRQDNNVATKVNAASKLIKLEESHRRRGDHAVPRAQSSWSRPSPSRCRRRPTTSVPTTTSATPRDRTGFGGLEAVDEVTMVAVPDLPPPRAAAPSTSRRSRPSSSG